MVDLDRTRFGLQRRSFPIEARDGGKGKGDEDEEEKEGEDEGASPDGEDLPGGSPGEDGGDEDEEEAEGDGEAPSLEPAGGAESPGPEGHEGGGEPEGDGEDEEEDKEERAGRFIVEGYAATFGEPYLLARWDGGALYERMDARAFDNAEMGDVILQYDHGGRVFARGANGTLRLACDSRGLKVRADLSGTEEGRKLWKEIRGGYTTKMSLSFTIDSDETEERSEGEILGRRAASGARCILRTIRRVGRVYDVSAVSLPANEGTEILARKRELLDGRRERLALELEISLAL